MFHMLSELPPFSIVGANIVLEHGNVDNFLNLFVNILVRTQYLEIPLVSVDSVNVSIGLSQLFPYLV